MHHLAILLRGAVKGRSGRFVRRFPLGKRRVTDDARVGHAIYRIVPEDVRIAVGDAKVVVISIDFVGTIQVAQGDGDLLRVTYKRTGVALRGRHGVVLHHDILLTTHPQCVERHTLVVDKQCVRYASDRLGIERQAKVMHRRASLHGAVEAKLGTTGVEALFVRLLEGYGFVMISARSHVEVHGKVFVCQGARGGSVAHRLLVKVVALLVEEIDGDAAHVVGKYVGIVEIIVVSEVYIQSLGALCEVFFHVATCGEGGNRCCEQDDLADDAFYHNDLVCANEYICTRECARGFVIGEKVFVCPALV